MKLHGVRRWLPRKARAPLGDATNPENWKLRAEIRGDAGFYFNNCGYSCIDIDGKHPGDPLGRWSSEIINIVRDAYIERSLSGTGLHVIGRSHLPPLDVSFRDGQLRVKRMMGFIALTEDGSGDPDIDITPALEYLHRSIPARSANAPQQSPRTGYKHASDRVDYDLLLEIAHSTQGERFLQLWRGDLTEYRGDHSEADLALASLLAWWCNYDYERVDKLFRKSDLMRPKWDARHRRSDGATYGQMTIERAFK